LLLFEFADDRAELFGPYALSDVQSLTFPDEERAVIVTVFVAFKKVSKFGHNL